MAHRLPAGSMRVFICCLLALAVHHAVADGDGKINRCGTSFADAGTKCLKCPKGVDSECPKGQRCFAGLPPCRSKSPQPGPGPTPPSGPVSCTLDEFNKAITSCGFKAQSDTKRKDMLASIKRLGGDKVISSKRELAMWMAQIIHESAGLSTLEEINGPSKPYAPYYGRGYIQLTGKANYLAASRAIFKDDRLVKNPKLVSANDNVAFDVSTYYWKTRVHNLPGVQQGLFGKTTLGINGGECNGTFDPKLACKRCRFYKNVLKAFNIGEAANCAGCGNC